MQVRYGHSCPALVHSLRTGFIGLSLVLLSSFALADETIVLQGARVIDGTGKLPRENVDITIRGGKIAKVAPSAAAPNGAKVVDCRGKTILPGLISAHAHVGQVDGILKSPKNYNRENILRQLRQYEVYGVTTIVTLGANQELLYELRPQLHAGKLPGADLFGADRGIGVTQGAPSDQALAIDANGIDRPQTAEEARIAVRAAKARGTDLIKIWVDDMQNTVPKMAREISAAAIDEAHRQGLRVAAHIFDLDDAKALVAAGVDVIAHGVRDQPVDPELIAAMKEKGVWYIPTLALDEATFIYADRPPWMQQEFFQHALQSPIRDEINSTAWREKTLASPSLENSRNALKMNQRNLAVMHKAGVKIGFGTDSGAMRLRIPGFAEHRELYLMVEAGLPPLEAITIATGRTANLLGLADRGTLAPERSADLIVLDADPADDIRHTQRILEVWHRGVRVSGRISEFQP